MEGLILKAMEETCTKDGRTAAKSRKNLLSNGQTLAKMPPFVFGRKI